MSATNDHSEQHVDMEVKTLPGCEDNFLRKDGNLYYSSGRNEHFLCTDLEVTAFARDTKSKKWGRMLKFTNMDGVVHEHFFSAQDLGKDGEKVISDLRDMGLLTTTEIGLLRKLAAYIYYAQPPNGNRVRCADRTGWHEDGTVYLMSDNTVIGEADERYAFQSSNSAFLQCSRQGSLEDWRENVSRLCRGNSRLMFVVCVSFATGLLSIVNAEGGGFNLFGRSSGGKTTALYVAASVIGRPKRYILRWRATDNGLEAMAKLHNDSILILDELGEIDPSKAGQCAYMLANGGGKIRSLSSGNAKQTAQWLLLFLSSAEITLAEHMSEAGKVAKAGQETRFADIPADAGSDMGLFETLHDSYSPAHFADRLKHNAEQFHGTAFPAFIESVVRQADSLVPEIKELKDKFLGDYVPKAVSGQIHRVAARFALVAAAGEWASQQGITGWDKGEAQIAVAKCFVDWLNNRSHTEDQEDVRIVATFKAYFQQYGESRFISARYNMQGVLNVIDNRRQPVRADGFKIIKPNDEVEFYVFPQSFNEICSNLNKATTITFLADNGLLVTANG